MLVLRRKAGEAIVLNGVITIHVLAVEGERVKLGISAPPEVVIVRSELLEGQGILPATPPPAMPPSGPREPNRPPREPDGEPGNGFEEGSGQHRDPNASNGSARFKPRNSTTDGNPLPFRPNSIRYGP